MCLTALESGVRAAIRTGHELRWRDQYAYSGASDVPIAATKKKIEKIILWICVANVPIARKHDVERKNFGVEFVVNFHERPA